MRRIFARHITVGNNCGGYVLFGRFPPLLALTRVLTAESKLWNLLVELMRKEDRLEIPTNTMGTGILSIALRSQLVALIAGSTDSPTDWGCRGVFANSGARLS